MHRRAMIGLAASGATTPRHPLRTRFWRDRTGRITTPFPIAIGPDATKAGH